MPIELFSFSAEREGKKAKLKWITDSEINNAFFTLERSNDAIHFQQIARVDGAGTSRERSDYEYFDSTPAAGINYYRLSQTDFDGQKTYFNIQSVYFEPNNNVVIYPNPNSGSFNIERKSDSRVQLSFVDSFGKTRWFDDTDQMLIRVNIPNLSKGIYFLKVADGINSFSEKVIIH